MAVPVLKERAVTLLLNPLARRRVTLIYLHIASQAAVLNETALRQQFHSCLEE